MQAYNMVNQSGFFAIGDGGRARPFQHGQTREVVYQERPEENWRKKAREMLERARDFYPSTKEAALEKELLAQVSGKSSTSSVSPRLAADSIALQAQRDRETALSRKLFDQVRGV